MSRPAAEVLDNLLESIYGLASEARMAGLQRKPDQAKALAEAVDAMAHAHYLLGGNE